MTSQTENKTQPYTTHSKSDGGISLAAAMQHVLHITLNSKLMTHSTSDKQHTSLNYIITKIQWNKHCVVIFKALRLFLSLQRLTCDLPQQLPEILLWITQNSLFLTPWRNTKWRQQMALTPFKQEFNYIQTVTYAILLQSIQYIFFVYLINYVLIIYMQFNILILNLSFKLYIKKN